MRVFAIQDGGGCGYYRIREPFDQMASQGLDVSYGLHQREHCKVGGCRNCGDLTADTDVFVGQRVGTADSMHQWLKLWRNHKIVWETDDDLWTIDPANTRATTFYTPELLEAVERIVRVAHMVTVSTDHLAEVMSRFNRNVVVLPNHINASLLDMERPHRGRLVVGWAGGDSHQRDLDMVKPHLGRFLRRNPDVELHTIGWGSERSPKDFPRHLRAHVHANPLHTMGVDYRHSGWSPRVTDYYSKIDFDIGLAPLTPGVFNQSKSAIKALEYAALGIPVVASDEGPYREFVEDGVTGFLVKYDHEWGSRLRDLVNDEDMRTEMGAAAKEKARAWTIQDGWSKWADAYASLV